jgi:hypothetical protein
MSTTPTETVTLTPEWSGAKRRTYFNTFDLDRKSEKGFVVARFAFVRWGDCVDCTTIILANTVVDQSRQSLLEYVKGVGLQAVDYEYRIPELPRFGQGLVDCADLINVGRSGDVGEITLHAFSIRYMIEAVNSHKKLPSAEFIAILRSNISLQIKWILDLYAQS